MYFVVLFQAMLTTNILPLDKYPLCGVIYGINHLIGLQSQILEDTVVHL